MTLSPCKDCTMELRNNINHHSLCAEYIKWKSEHDKVMEKKKKYDYTVMRINRIYF